MVKKKPLGYGSLSLVLLLSGFLINMKFGNDFNVSQSIFNTIGLDKYSNGTDGFYYPFLLSMPFWIAAVLVSRKHVKDFGAVVSNKIGEFLVAISVIATIIFLILPIWIKF